MTGTDGPTSRGPYGARSETSPEAIRDDFRAAEAVAMRRAGRTLREVVETCGYYDTRTASRAIKRYLREYGREDAEAYRDLQIERYEAMLTTLWPVFEHGGKDGAVSLFAADRMLAAMKELSVLTGADKVAPAPSPEDPEELAAPSQARTLAQLVGGDEVKARALARALHEAGVFEKPRSTAVIEHEGPPDSV